MFLCRCEIFSIKSLYVCEYFRDRGRSDEVDQQDSLTRLLMAEGSADDFSVPSHNLKVWTKPMCYILQDALVCSRTIYKYFAVRSLIFRLLCLKKVVGLALRLY